MSGSVQNQFQLHGFGTFFHFEAESSVRPPEGGSSRRYRSVSSRLAHLPRVRDRFDASVLLLQAVDHVEEILPVFHFVSESSETIDDRLEMQKHTFNPNFKT